MKLKTISFIFIVHLGQLNLTCVIDTMLLWSFERAPVFIARFEIWYAFIKQIYRCLDKGFD